MKTFTAYIEFDPDTNLYVGTIPGIPGTHSQGATLDELQNNLKEVLEFGGSMPTPDLIQQQREIVSKFHQAKRP